MKKVFILLIPIIIFDLLLDGEQVIKLPFLITHYTEHQKKEHIGFLDFLILHYISNHSNQAEHHHLPFKDHHNCAHIHFYFNKFYYINMKHYAFSETNYFIPSEHSYCLNNHTSVWHPPKV